jgi:hypothetical protein
MRARLGFALVLVLAGTVSAHGQEITHNGYWWMDATKSFKLGFATGYAMAMTSAADAAALKCVEAKNGGTLPMHPSDEATATCEQTPEVTGLSYSNLRVGQLVDGVDQFYQDFRNKSIDVGVAMRYVKDELRGKTDKELEDELTDFRRLFNK